MVHLIVNGILAQPPGWYRIDDQEEGRTGLDHLEHPYAIARTHEIAETICKAVNSQEAGEDLTQRDDRG